jgi:membrane protease YdiL (CAAX protease family)
MDKELLKRLHGMVSAIIRGDYSRAQDIDHTISKAGGDHDEEQFLESLGMMAVKLEAREFELEKTIKNLKSRNAELLEEREKNKIFSTLFITLFLAIALYVFLIFLFRNLHLEFKDSARMVEVIFLVACIIIIRKSGFPFSYLGVTLKGAMASLRHMLPGTLIACVVLIGLKSLFLLTGFKGMENSLFITGNFNLELLLYIPIAALQEFLSRGVIQTAIKHVLKKRHATFWAILTASALFGLVHVQISVSLAVASFIFGLFWGYIYNKQNSLVGVSISHFLIGGLAYILGFWDFLFII